MELETNIKEDFKSLIATHNFLLSRLTSNHVKLENEYCIIDLQLERDVEFYVTFIDKNTNREYAMMNLIFFRGLQQRKK